MWLKVIWVGGKTIKMKRETRVREGLRKFPQVADSSL